MLFKSTPDTVPLFLTEDVKVVFSQKVSFVGTSL